MTDAGDATARKQFFLHVSDDLSISTGVLPDGAKDVGYNFVLEATGGLLPYTWRLKTGTLPSGLTLNTTTGAIYGTPTTRQTYSFTVEVNDSDSPAQTAQKTYTMEVLDGLYVYTETIPNGRIDEAYTATVSARLGETTLQLAAGKRNPAHGAEPDLLSHNGRCCGNALGGGNLPLYPGSAGYGDAGENRDTGIYGERLRRCGHHQHGDQLRLPGGSLFGLFDGLRGRASLYMAPDRRKSSHRAGPQLRHGPYFGHHRPGGGAEFHIYRSRDGFGQSLRVG